MASELEVTTIRGLSSGADANKIIVPSGQTLSAPGHVTQVKQLILTTAESITSTSFTNSSVTVSITPSLTTSKVRVTIRNLI